MTAFQAAMTAALKRACALVSAALLAVGFTACAKSVSTAGFSGEDREVAQTISNLQADVTAGDEGKICTNDLASVVVARLDRARGGCKQAIKNQLAEVDNDELSVQSVSVTGAGTQRTAIAHVRSIYGGKTRAGTISLLKEGAKWKIQGVS